MEQLIHKIEEYYQKYSEFTYPVLILSLFLAGTLSVLYGLFFSKTPVQAKQELLPQVFQTNPESEDELIMVDISGAVEKPGLYELKANDRMATLIEKSGGYSKKVHKAYVARSVNLSQKLRDEEKIYIPFQGEPVHSIQQPLVNVGTTASRKAFININTASSAELEQLPGIGQVRAQNIVSGRPYKTAQELLSKKIVTQKIFDDIKDKLTF